MQSSNLRYLIATLMLLISCASFYVFITKHVALQAALPCETVTQNGVLSQNLDGTLLLKMALCRLVWNATVSYGYRWSERMSG